MSGVLGIVIMGPIAIAISAALSVVTIPGAIFTLDPYIGGLNPLDTMSRIMLSNEVDKEQIMQVGNYINHNTEISSLAISEYREKQIIAQSSRGGKKSRRHKKGLLGMSFLDVVAGAAVGLYAAGKVAKAICGDGSCSSSSSSSETNDSFENGIKKIDDISCFLTTGADFYKCKKVTCLDGSRSSPVGQRKKDGRWVQYSISPFETSASSIEEWGRKYCD